MRNNPRNWRIEDLLALARRNDIAVRQGGSSHVHFVHEAVTQHLSIPADKPLKPVYVKLFLEFLDAIKEKTI